MELRNQTGLLPASSVNKKAPAGAGVSDHFSGPESTKAEY